MLVRARQRRPGLLLDRVGVGVDNRGVLVVEKRAERGDALLVRGLDRLIPDREHAGSGEEAVLPDHQIEVEFLGVHGGYITRESVGWVKGVSVRVDMGGGG